MIHILHDLAPTPLRNVKAAAGMTKVGMEPRAPGLESLEHLVSQGPVPFLDLVPDSPNQHGDGFRVAGSWIAAIAPMAVAFLLRPLP